MFLGDLQSIEGARMHWRVISVVIHGYKSYGWGKKLEMSTSQTLRERV